MSRLIDPRDVVTGQCKFFGSMTQSEFDSWSKENKENGSIVFISDSQTNYVYVDGIWSKLGSVEDLSSSHDQNSMHKKIITNCSHCGAPLPLTERALEKGYVKCEFCRSICNTFNWEG